MLVVLYAVHEKAKGVRTMYGMFFFLMCFWVVLSCSVFVPKKPIKPKNLKTFFKNLGFFQPVKSSQGLESAVSSLDSRLQSRAH